MQIDEATFKHVRAGFFYRGPEIAFLVRQGDLDALTDVMEKCTFWNGANSLIIPVAKNGITPKWVPLLLESHPVETFLFHESISQDAKRRVRDRFADEQPGNWYDLHEEFDLNELHPLLLQHQPSVGETPPSLLIPRPSSPRLERISLATWGHLPEIDEPYYRRYFELGEVRGEDSNRAMLVGQLSSFAPTAQSVNLIQHFGPVGVGRHLWIFDRASFSELVNFWNIRGRTDRYSDVPLLTGAPKEILESSSALNALAAYIRRDTFADHTPDIGVTVVPQLKSQVVKAFEAAGFSENKSGRVRRLHLSQEDADPSKDLSFAFFGPHVSRPFSRGAVMHEQLTFLNGKASFRPPHPPAMPSTGHRVRVGISGLPLTFPLTNRAAAEIYPGARSAPEGLLVDIEARTPFMDLEIPDSKSALEYWASSSELKVVPSQAGRYGQALLDRLGNLDALESLASDDAIDVLLSLAPLSRLKLAQRVVAEAEKSGETLSEQLLAHELRKDTSFIDLRARHADEIGGVVGKPQKQLMPHLARLIESGFVTRGARVRCPRCNFEDVLGLSEQKETISCKACFEKFTLPVIDVGEAEEVTPVYRLDGLMARAMDQDLLSVLLALRYLNLDAAPPLLAAWPGLEFSDQTKTVEVDLLTTNGEEVTVVECKANAVLADHELEKLLRLASRLGARPAVAAMNGRFSADTKTALSEAGGLALERESLLTPPFEK